MPQEGKKLSLYLVQDDDRPMYVVAAGWLGALAAWRCQLVEEAEPEHRAECATADPNGIQILSAHYERELLLPRGEALLDVPGEVREALAAIESAVQGPAGTVIDWARELAEVSDV